MLFCVKSRLIVVIRKLIGESERGSFCIELADEESNTMCFKSLLWQFTINFFNDPSSSGIASCVGTAGMVTWHLHLTRPCCECQFDNNGLDVQTLGLWIIDKARDEKFENFGKIIWENKIRPLLKTQEKDFQDLPCKIFLVLLHLSC